MKRIAYLLVRYPTLSQTFIQREVEGLREAGLDVMVFGCRQFGGGDARTLSLRSVADFFITVLSTLFQKPKRVLNFLRILPKCQWNGVENLLANAWGFLAGLALANQAKRNGIEHIHAGWATLPATAGWVMASLLDVPFSFGAHAYDLYRNGGDGFLEEKLKRAVFVHTTTRMAEQTLRKLAPNQKIVLARRGLTELPPFQPREWSGAVQILSIGRLVPKKGHAFQLQACHVLKSRGVDFHLHIIGGGVLKKELVQTTSKLGLEHHITFWGAQTPEETAQHFHRAHLFWHTGIVASDGDRDGLPNVIPEAMAHGVPVISSPEPGAGEAVLHHETGLVVDITDAEKLANAVQELAGNAELRARLTQTARCWVEENFCVSKNAKILVHAFH